MKPRNAVAHSDDGRLRRWQAGALAVVVAATLLLASCGGGKGGEQPQQGQAEPQQRPAEDVPPEAGDAGTTEVTVEQITTDPKKFYGKRVTVSAQISDMVDEPNAFAIGGGEEFSGTDRLLVVGAQPMPKVQKGKPKLVNEGLRVRVTGTVRRFDIEKFQQELDYGLEDEYFGVYRGDPAVLASSIVVTPQLGEDTAGSTVQQ